MNYRELAEMIVAEIVHHPLIDFNFNLHDQEEIISAVELILQSQLTKHDN